MKIKTIIFIVILLLLTAVFVKFSSKEEVVDFKPLELNVGDTFDKLDYSDSMSVINYAIGDVTGDEEKDMIIMVGKKDAPDSMEATKVDVVVYDTKNQSFRKAGLKGYEGKSPKIYLADYTGNNQNDILVILDNKDATKNIRILACEEESLKEIWNRRDNRGLVFVGEMVDGMKAHLRCGKYSKEMYVDVGDMKTALLQEGKVNDSGKIISENKTISTTSFTMVDNIEMNQQMGLQTTQRIVTFDNNTIVDEVNVIWKYENGKWQIVEAKGNRIGSL